MVKRSHYLKGITIMANLETKLKALLAAGLIGTAGLGMQSCSNPSDSVYYPYTYTVEAPSTDNPGSGGGTENPGNGGGAETSNPSGGEENGGETKVTFNDLGVNDTDVQRRIANTGKPDFLASVNSSSLKNISGSSVFVYIKESNPVFQSIPEDLPSDYNNGAFDYICVDDGVIYDYIIPADLKNSFDKAIAAYTKPSQSN